MSRLFQYLERFKAHPLTQSLTDSLPHSSGINNVNNIIRLNMINNVDNIIRLNIINIL